uniref:Uncharacterized protein LOC114334779 n=1 Tax=Diabrotica virgifera virgifera TaxID=50390 RepID=A0A6P7G809_DIAVI
MAIGTVDIKVSTNIAKNQIRKTCFFKEEDSKPGCSYLDVQENFLESSSSGEDNEEDDVEFDSSFVKSLGETKSKTTTLTRRNLKFESVASTLIQEEEDDIPGKRSDPGPDDVSDKSNLKNKSLSQMRLELPSVALACDRTGVSDRAAAIIVNAVLEDTGVISKGNATMTIDRTKIRRARISQRELCMAKPTEKPAIIGLFFDGRKDRTQIYKTTANKRRCITEKHISLVSEPGSQYTG